VLTAKSAGMTSATQDITIPSADGGAIPAYIAVPPVVPAPALIIIAAVSGLDGVARDWADRYAAHGFLTVVPDFFWRTIPGPMRLDVPDERAKATERNQKFDVEAGVRDIAAVRDYLHGLPESNGKWAAAGYCFGGRYTLLAGANLGADAVIGFHPSKMGLELEAADESVPMDVVYEVQDALKGNPLAETYVYPGIQHGFTAKGRAAYDEAASELAFERALHVLDKLKTAHV
jgi:carboxymethylenebutenolidase